MITIISCFGSILGFIYFLFELESPSMGGVIFRPNSDGIREISWSSIWNIMIAPFKYLNFWTNYELYSINWIIMILIGGLIGGLIGYIIRKIDNII
jgi:uncharacterized membrane protein YpjA